VISPLVSPVLFHVGPIPISEPVVVTRGIMAALTVGSLALRRRLKLLPASIQAACELVVEAVDSQIRDTMRVDPAPYRAFIGTLFVFIFVANWSSLVPGVTPPTARLETDAALALIVFVAVIWFGVRAGGLEGYLATFATPSPLMIPLNFVESLTRTFSLLIRLFGNVMSGVFVIGLILSLAGLVAPIPLMALDLLTGAVQAYIFAVLATVFVAGASPKPLPNRHQKKGRRHELDRRRQHRIGRARRRLRSDRPGARGRARRRRGDGRDRPPARGGQQHLAHAVRRIGDDRDDGDLLPGDRAAAAVRQSAAEMTA
jgi:F-type H+-transporting ATPase subunit a